LRCGLFNGPIENIADLDRVVAAGTEQAQRSGSGKRAYFMMHLSAAVEEEALDGVQRGGGQFLENARSESLRDWRADAIEDRIRSRTFHPFGAAGGEQAAAGLGELVKRRKAS